MNKFLEKSENIPLAYNEFEKIINPVRHHMITHTSLLGKKTYKQIFGNSRAVVIYLPAKDREVGHWVCMIDHGGRPEFFDPYGKTYIKLCQILGLRPSPLLVNQPPIYNTVQYQKQRENINDCGRHVAVRSRFAFLPLNRYAKFIKYPKCPDADGTVTLLTMLVSPKNFNFNKLIP